MALPITLDAGLNPGATTVICDDAAVAAAVMAGGWPDVRRMDHVDEWRTPPASITVLLCGDPATAQDTRLSPMLYDRGVLHIPLYAFDADPAIAAYTMDILTRSDFPAAVRRNQEWVRRFETESVLHFLSGHDHHNRLTCTPADAITVSTALSCELPPGQAKPLGLYFEVEMERLASTPAPFIVNGSLHVDGVVYALADSFDGGPGARRALGHQLLQAAQARGLDLVIQENRLVSCMTPAGASVLPIIAAAVNDDMVLSEFAIGSNRLARPNFALNAQVNEGAGGIHIGLGGGPGTLHIDFVALHARAVEPAGATALTPVP